MTHSYVWHDSGGSWMAQINVHIQGHLIVQISLHFRWGWIIFQRMRILSEIQFTMHFIESVVVETKRFVGSNENVILTRQTCGQRSSRAAGGKRWALAFIVAIQIWHMFWGSKCIGESNLDVCTTSALAKKILLRSADFRQILWPNTFFNRNSALRSQVQKLCTDLDRTFFYILVSWTYIKFARKNKMLALGVCFSQTCTSAGRMFAASRSRLHYYRPILSFEEYPTPP